MDNDVDSELHGRYRGLLARQLTEAASAALEARWLARDLRARAEELLCAASTATDPARAGRLRVAGNGLANRAEQLEELAACHQAASTTTEAALGRTREPTATTDEDHPG